MLKRLKRKLAVGSMRRGGSLRNVLTLLAGTVSAQAISLAVTPLLARLYSPEDFGLLATFMMLSNNLAMFATLSYYGAIVLPKRDESAFALVFTCILLSAGVSGLVGIFVVFAGDNLAAWLRNPELAEWLWLLPVSIFAWGGFETIATWCTRRRNFLSISTGTVNRRLVASGSQLAFGAAGANPGLLAGQVIGELTGFVLLAWRGLREAPRRYWSTIRWSRIWVLLHRYRRFPTYDLFSSATAAFARNMPVLGLGIFFNPAIVGFFMMANRLVAAPLQLGAASVTRVLFERANRAKLEGTLPSLSLSVYQRLFMVITTPLALLCIAAPELIEILLGSRWETAADYLRWITLWLLFSSTASPLHRLFAVLESQNELAIINGILFVTSALSFLLGGWLGDDMLTVAMFCVSSAVIWAIQGLRVLHIAGARLGDALKVIVRELIRALPYTAVMLATQLFSDNNWLICGVFGLTLAVFAAIHLRKLLV